MSAFMSDRTPEDQRFVRLQMLVYDILRAEDGGQLATPQMVDGFVKKILALDTAPAQGDVAGLVEALEKIAKLKGSNGARFIAQDAIAALSPTLRRTGESVLAAAKEAGR